MILDNEMGGHRVNGPAPAQEVSSPMRSQANQPLRERVERGIYKRTTKDGAIRYEVAFQDGDGRQRWRTVAKLQEARQLRAELVSKVARGEVVAPANTTFAELAESWYEARSARLRPRTVRYYRDALDLVLLPRFGRYRLAAIDADAVAKLTRDLEHEGLHAIDPARTKRPLGRSSVSNYLKPLQGVLALAVRRRLIPSSPFDVLTQDDRPVHGERRQVHEWTPEEVAALVAAAEKLADRKVSKYDYSPLIRLTAALGLRLGEVLGLRWEDFDKDADDTSGVLCVRRQWTQQGEYGPTKTAAGVRRIPLSLGLRELLVALRLRSRFSDDRDPVFASATGSPLGHRNVTRRGFEPARDLAGLPSSVTFHDLRHAVASRLIGAGLDPVTVAGVLGHEDANVTLRVYAHLFDRTRTDDAVRAALAAGERS
jgi:integrase